MLISSNVIMDLDDVLKECEIRSEFGRSEGLVKGLPNVVIRVHSVHDGGCRFQGGSRYRDRNSIADVSLIKRDMKTSIQGRLRCRNQGILGSDSKYRDLVVF